MVANISHLLVTQTCMLTQLLNNDLGIGVWRCLCTKDLDCALGVNSVWGKDRCVLSHQDSKFSGKCFWKAPHSYSNRLTATNRQTKHYKTLTVDGRQLTDGNNWLMFYMMRHMESWELCRRKRRLVVLCVSECRIRVGKCLWHEWVVKCPNSCDTWWSEEEVGSGWSGPCY